MFVRVKLLERSPASRDSRCPILEGKNSPKHAAFTLAPIVACTHAKPKAWLDDFCGYVGKKCALSHFFRQSGYRPKKQKHRNKTSKRKHKVKIDFDVRNFPPENVTILLRTKAGETQAASLEDLHALEQELAGTDHWKSPDICPVSRSDNLGQLPETAARAPCHTLSEYAPHPYLLETREFVGRKLELRKLSQWLTGKSPDLSDVRIFTLMAIGGMGKSALAWEWFKNYVPKIQPELDGRLWWSFFEPGAHYENFLIRALAYVSQEKEESIRQLTFAEREERLFLILDQRPFLLVLDGLERILLAYSSLDASHLRDDDLDEKTANYPAGTLPHSGEADSRINLRCTVDRRAGWFLRKLTKVEKSRILITTRLYPEALRGATGQLLPHCWEEKLGGMADRDALSLWRQLGVQGGNEDILSLSRPLGNHPLFLRILACKVAAWREAPYSFDDWKRAHPEFKPGNIPLINFKTHVLELVLDRLSTESRLVLNLLAAFRMPADFETLKAVVPEWLNFDLAPPSDGKSQRLIDKLDPILEQLEKSGLLGWNKTSNRYDLHPVIRAVVWERMDASTRKSIYDAVYRQASKNLSSQPQDWKKVEKIEDLTPAVEVFHALVCLGRLKEALRIFQEHLDPHTLYRLSANDVRVELLEAVYTDLTKAAIQILDDPTQGKILNDFGLALKNVGKPKKSVPPFLAAVETAQRCADCSGVSTYRGNLAWAYWHSGQLYQAENSAFQSLAYLRSQKMSWEHGCFRDTHADGFHMDGSYGTLEAFCLGIIGISSSARGAFTQAESCLQRAIAIYSRSPRRSQTQNQNLGILTAYLVMHFLWKGKKSGNLLELLDQVEAYAKEEQHKRDIVRLLRLRGAVHLVNHDLAKAESCLASAYDLARGIQFVQEELAVSVRLAEVFHRQGRWDAALEIIDEIEFLAEQGPYPLRHSDALLIRSSAFMAKGNLREATVWAALAFKKAWCDGPPYAYHSGLTKARTLLEKLASPLPPLPPFDTAWLRELPMVELNPDDEFQFA